MIRSLISESRICKRNSLRNIVLLNAFRSQPSKTIHLDQMEDAQKIPSGNESPVLIIATTISIALIGFAIFVGLNGQPFFSPLLSPNEVGDFLAGFAGALAFVWIIAAIFMQHEELKLQRKELALTRRETSRLADQNEKQALALQTSARAYFVERWERSLKLLYDIQIENAAYEFLKTIYSCEPTQQAAKKWIMEKFPGAGSFSIQKFRSRDITRLYLRPGHYVAELSGEISILVPPNTQILDHEFRSNIPKSEISPKQIAEAHNVQLNNLSTVVVEGSDLGLSALMREQNADQIIYPNFENNQTQRVVRSFLTALVDELICNYENQKTT